MRAFWDNRTDHFGGCPECGHHDGYLNIGKGHWFFCREHRVRWFAGSDLFSSWRDETEEEQRATFDAIDFGTFRVVEPPDPEPRARRRHRTTEDDVG